MMKHRISRTVRIPRTLCLGFATLLLAWIGWGAASVAGQESEPAEEKPAAEAAEAPDPYAVPEDADADELLQFIRDLQRMQPPGRTRPAILNHIRQVVTASIEAADKVLDGETTEEQAAAAVEQKLNMLNMAENLRLPDAAQKRKEFVESIQNDARPAIVSLAKRFGLVEQARQWRTIEPDAKEVFLEQVTAYLDAEELGQVHLQFLSNIVQLIRRAQDSDTADKLCAAAEPLFLKIDNRQLVDQAKQFFLTNDLNGWPDLAAKEKEALMERVIAYLDATEIGIQHLQWINQLGRQIEHTGTPEEAAQLFVSVQPIFLKSDNERIVESARSFDGIVRRLRLPGNEMPIEGTLLNGTEFDWSSYKGKVVLVDFWATWCGPCIHEMPNVKEAYANYHEKGFDVVGISLDQDREAVEKYVEKEEIPWAILYSDDEGATGWKHPMAVHYGIHAIPTTILVDQNGKVFSLSARGQQLTNQLQELLGDPAPTETTQESNGAATGAGEATPSDKEAKEN